MKGVDEVSAFEAKTHLSELLKETERGRSFLIRRRGKPVARLVPPVESERPLPMADILRGFKEIRLRSRGRLRVKELIEEGRRR